jgi:hypothetical protein
VRAIMKHQWQHQPIIASLLFVAFAACASACGASRTAAATQNTPAAFDPSTSDPQAIQAADAMAAALGAEKWAQVKQVRWEVKYLMNNELKGWFKHSWDIWNGRHRYELAPPDQLSAPDPIFTFAMYDLFNRGKGFVANTKDPHTRAPAAETQHIIEGAYESWQRDAYQLSMFFKLRDPGVKLTYAGERQDFMGHCNPACHDIKVTFVAEVGSDTYHVLINKQTNLPEVVEKFVEGGKLGYHVGEWKEIQGIKLPALYKNLGTDEKFVLDNIRIGEPDDELYVPQVRG